jgi:PEP-CTERM motif
MMKSFKSRLPLALSAAVAMAFMAVQTTRAALITGPWTSAQGDGPIANGNTSQPLVGDGSADSAGGEMFHSAFPAVTLANSGDKIVFDGKVQLTGTVGSPANAGGPRSQFRFGLYGDDGAGDPHEGWVGYLAYNRHGDAGGTPPGRIVRKNVGNTNLYHQTTGAGNQTNLALLDGDGSVFHDDLYTMNMTIERSGNDLVISASLSGSNGYTNSLSVTDTNASTMGTYTFDRVGFLLGGNLAADRAQFYSLSISIPEPASLLLVLVGLIGAFCSRRRGL